MENDNFENEIWLPIADYPNYQISNYGRVKSLKYCHGSKEKLLKLTQHSSGYLIVCLVKNKKNNNFYIHRLVAQAFLPNPNNMSCINHIDENKYNNHIDNLEWCNHAYNNSYGTRIERAAKSKTKPVNQYSLDGTFIKKWESVHEIQKQLGFNFQFTRNCCNGKIKTANGYIWRYA